MSLYPGGLLPWVPEQFFDADGDPLAGGFLFFYIAGTDTPLDTFTQADLDPGAANPNPIQLNNDGRPPDPIFLQPTGYKVVCTDADSVQLWSVDEVEDVGATFAATFGNVQAEGGKDVTDGYIILSTDRLVTCDSAAGAMTVTLLSAASATQQLIIMNAGANAVTIEPDGADTINGTNGALTLAAASGQAWPSVILYPDAVSSWYALPIG